MSEIDRLAQRPAYGSVRVGAAYAAPQAPLLTADQAQALLTSKVETVLMALFDNRTPWDAVAAVCGRTPAYWEGALKPGKERRKAVNDLLVGLRAHIAGVRDHLNDVEKTVVDCSRLIDQIDQMKR
jgi:hypothetical protein